MGRTRGSKNKLASEPQLVQNKPLSSPKDSKRNSSPKKQKIEKTEVFAVSLLETPLFLCRSCRSSFETTEEYAQHQCEAQTFTIAYAEETSQETQFVEIEEDKLLKEKEKKAKTLRQPSKTRNKKHLTKETSPEAEFIEFEEVTELDEELEEKSKPAKAPRKPYKKREKKLAGAKESKDPVKCPSCEKTFTRKYHLERHLVHTSCNPGTYEKQEFSCEVCNKVFSRVDNLRMHLRAHLGQKSRSRDFQCPYCEKSFYGSSLLNIHVRTHTREKPYLCDWEGCGKGFPSSGALTKHRRVHTGERPYSCPICFNRFAAKETLNRHVRTHTGRKDHKCQICGKEFIQNTQLKAHMFYHNGENALECDQCGKQFNRKTRLREHLEYIHLKKEMPSCNMCSKKFMRREDLNRHVETHIGERLHSCSCCDKKFVTKAAVRIHMRVHQKEEPARCGYCNKNFLRMDCLVRHVRAKHRTMLQQIIVEAETKKIISTLNGEEQIEIIYYDDSQASETFDVVKPDDNLKTEGEEGEEDDDCGAPIFLDDKLLMDRISDLLQIVIEESLLKKLGFGKKPLDDVLCSVLEQCSRTPLKKGESEDDDSTRMRENTKQLFSIVLDEDHIKSILNNYTVDEVITIVLRMAK